MTPVCMCGINKNAFMSGCIWSVGSNDNSVVYHTLFLQELLSYHFDAPYVTFCKTKSLPQSNIPSVSWGKNDTLSSNHQSLN